EPAVRFARNGHHFITHSKIQGDVWPPPPIVLYVCPDQGLSNIPWSRSDQCRSKVLRLIGEKIGKRAKVPITGCIPKCLDVVQHSLKATAKFDGVNSVRQKRIVIALKRIPIMEIMIDGTESSSKIGDDPTNVDSRGKLSWRR